MGIYLENTNSVSLNDQDYTLNKNWLVIDSYIKTRNFYIHSKPEIEETVSMHEEKLNKASIRSFLDASYECYSFLNRYHSKEAKDYLDRVCNLKARMTKEFEETRNSGEQDKHNLLK